MMRVMPRLQKLVSSVRSGRNHCGRVVGNSSLTGLWKCCPRSNQNPNPATPRGKRYGLLTPVIPLEEPLLQKELIGAGVRLERF